MMPKLQEIIDAWNEQADKYNSWDELSTEEQLEFVIKFMSQEQKKYRPLALAADRMRRELDELRGVVR